MSSDGLTVVMTTYLPDGPVGEARLGYAKHTIDALYDVVDHGLGLLVVTHDGPQNNWLHNLSRHMDAIRLNSVIYYGPRNGIGASLNRAMHAITGNWMYITDDWLLQKPIDFGKAIALLKDYDYVRLGPLHPNLACTTKFNKELGWWLELHTGSGFTFATRPFVATKTFYNYIGPFDEGLDAYETERLYNKRVSMFSPKMAALLSDGTEWEHIGAVEVGREAIYTT